MDEFNQDLLKLLADWSVWKLIDLNPERMTATIARYDEFSMHISVEVGRSYPSGSTVLRSNGDVYATTPGQRISDALDEALSRWDTSEQQEAPASVAASAVYDASVLCNPGAVGHVRAVPREAVAPSALLNELHVQRVKHTWERIGSQLPECHVFFDATRTALTLHLGVSCRDLDPLRRVSLELRDAEYLCVALSAPFQFPRDRPTVLRVFLCNEPDKYQDSADVRHEHIGVFSWYLAHRVNRFWEKACAGLNDELYTDGEEGEEVHHQSASSRYLWLDPEMFVGPQKVFEAALQELLAQPENVLTGCLSTVMHLIDQSTSHCFVCDLPLSVEGMKMITCGSELCAFSVEQLGLGVDVLSEITKRAEVFELLMLFVHASAAHGDKRDVFTPMCNVNVEHKRATLRFGGPANFYTTISGKKTKNFQLLLEVVQLVPSVAEMVAIANGCNRSLRDVLDRKHPLVYPFLQWVVSSNHAHVAHVPPLHQVRWLGPHQYLVIHHHPAQEQRFRRLQAAARVERGGGDSRGSFFAWHGSGTFNWHSILRDGLKVYSGTRFMTSGQVYGAGIYLARNIATSMSYMAPSSGCWKGSSRFAHPAGCSVISLCEVVDDPRLFKDHNGDIITVLDEDAICTRFLFVFPGHHVPTPSLSSIASGAEIAAQLCAAFPYLSF